VTGKQGKYQRGPETDHSAGVRRASSRVFRGDSRNEFQGIMEEPATTQTEEETTSSLRAGGVGALTILGNFARTDRKRRIMVIYLAPYEGTARDEGVAGAVGK
jgi:hypothetical protein